MHGTLIKNSNIKHIAIIPDGNRRWAESKGLNRQEGHHAMVRSIPSLFAFLIDSGVHTVTFWLASPENFIKRDDSEIAHLYEYFEILIDKLLSGYSNTKICHLGEKHIFPKRFLNKIRLAEQTTQNCNGNIINLAINYSANQEIIWIANKIKDSYVSNESWCEQTIEKLLCKENRVYSHIDMIIRTGREKRLSGFMSWWSSYAELFFVQKYFPDFSCDDLKNCIYDFSNRNKRFGK